MDTENDAENNNKAMDNRDINNKAKAMDSRDSNNKAMDNRDSNKWVDNKDMAAALDNNKDSNKWADSKDMAALDSNRDSNKWADRKDMAADSNRGTNNPADSSSTDTNNKAMYSNLSKDMDNNRAMAKAKDMECNKCKCHKDPGRKVEGMVRYRVTCSMRNLKTCMDNG